MLKRWDLFVQLRRGRCNNAFATFPASLFASLIRLVKDIIRGFALPYRRLIDNLVIGCQGRRKKYSWTCLVRRRGRRRLLTGLDVLE
jgi:hypothetical protein